jgi:vancomycin resistance protein YoaR/membrane protein implicated in regulation of membrane protease activity
MSPEYTRYTPKSERRVPRSSARKSTSPARKPRKKQSLAAQILALVAILIVWPLRALFAKGTLRKTIAVGVCCVVGVVALFAVVDWLSSRDAIHRGVQVYGIDVGGMRVREAAALINKAQVSDGTVEVSYEGESWTIPVSDLKGRLDGRAAARQAYRYTRDGNYFAQLGRRALLWMSGTEVEPPVRYDQPALKQAIDAIAREVEVKPVAASVKIDGTEAKVKGAREGLAIDREALEALFVHATLDGTTIKEDLPVDVVEPAVSTDEARAAAEQARGFLAGDLTLKREDKTVTITRDELGQYLAFVQRQDEPHFRATFASRITEGYFDYITEQIGDPGKDASFKIVGGGRRVKVVEGTIGYGVVFKKTVANMEAAAREQGDARVAEIVMGKARPARSVDEAEAMGITTRIATYTTGVSGTTNRLANVRLGAELIDDTLIAPGDVFSMNGTTGERTAAAGFKMAPVIIAGKLEDAIGGGMCQVSTTVFNAAFGAGLEIVERHNHMLYISHYPLGRDATVNYGSYDLKFRNDTEHWILLKTTFSGWSLNVSLYSSPLRRKVTSTVGPQYNQVAHTTQKKDDPTLAEGKTKVETPGVDGWSIDCFRKVWENGKLIHNDVFKSVYSMVPEVVLVGTKAKPSPSPSPSSTKKPSPKPSPSGN